jgi:hypothetical protein
MNRNLGYLGTVAVAHAGGELALESGADAAGSDRIIDDVVGPGLADGYRRKPGHQNLPWVRSVADPAIAEHRPPRADRMRPNTVCPALAYGHPYPSAGRGNL